MDVSCHGDGLWWMWVAMEMGCDGCKLPWRWAVMDVSCHGDELWWMRVAMEMSCDGCELPWRWVKMDVSCHGDELLLMCSRGRPVPKQWQGWEGARLQCGQHAHVPAALWRTHTGEEGWRCEGGGDKVSKLVFYPQSASVVISGLGLKLKSKCIYWLSTATVKTPPPHTHTHTQTNIYRERELFEALAQVGERGERQWGKREGVGLTIKSTTNISNWTTVTVSSKCIQWLIIHNHVHCLFCIVTNSCPWWTAPWRNASHFHKSKKYSKCSKNQADKETSVPYESQSCFCHITNFGTMCGFIHKRFKRFSNSTDPNGLSHTISVTVTFSLQVAAQWYCQWKGYGSL